MKIYELETASAETHLDIFKCLSAEEKVIAAHESLAYGIAHEVEQIVFAVAFMGDTSRVAKGRVELPACADLYSMSCTKLNKIFICL